MKILDKLIGIIFLFAALMACSDNDEENMETSKPAIDISISPQQGLNFGDQISVAGMIMDDRNLEMYTINIFDQADNLLVEKTQMLLGKSFEVDENITIPLIAGATNTSLRLMFTLKNSRGGTDEKEFSVSNVNVPQFEQLFLILENNTSYEMTRNGNVFEVDNTFPANARGYFSTSPLRNGLFWGTTGGKIVSLGKDPIVVGHEIEASYKITFNPYTFDLTLGKYAMWSPLPDSDCFYILGTISGHWQDGEIIAEKAKMKMKGFQSEQQRYYSWIPPAGDDPETGMWGEIAAGDFRLKRGGEDVYILWDGQTIIEGSTNDKDRSFHTSSAGALEIRVYFDGDKCTSVRLLGSDRTLEFEPNVVKVNGSKIAGDIRFADSTVPLKESANYVYESKINLKKGQTITSSDVDLKRLAGDSDLFNGVGNTSWTLATAGGTYLVRIDLFSGEFYACPMNGYPDVIYLNGWSWAKTASNSAVVFNPDYDLALTHVGNNVYESTLYNFGWGGSFSLDARHPYSGEEKASIPSGLFTTGFDLPAAVGRYKISVNLKDGIKITGSTVESTNNQKLTIEFKLL